ncbi:chloramphenicol 3-O-phosphotransferase [Paraburkholderia sp. GAS41]|jgi:chloramphenicol 3-O phosphotransferase|uniref:phosphotransferase-like protein n=1 Tax=Paraburkholderia sp. GAS41 TaxID=3035134 RepID=UPI003D20CD73
MQTTKVILLNDVGSSGKTSLPERCRQHRRTCFLHVQMDSFLAMLPARLRQETAIYSPEYPTIFFDDVVMVQH